MVTCVKGSDNPPNDAVGEPYLYDFRNVMSQSLMLCIFSS